MYNDQNEMVFWYSLSKALSAPGQNPEMSEVSRGALADFARGIAAVGDKYLCVGKSMNTPECINYVAQYISSEKWLGLSGKLNYFAPK